jgi:FkbM family methyltransferase
MLFNPFWKRNRFKKIGTDYGGWFIPNDIELNSGSIVYSAGVGEDISFDLQLSSNYNCYILLIDPTPRSLVHFQEVQKYYLTNNWLFTGNIQKDYKRNIEGINIDFSKIKFLPIALWDENSELKFYKQNNKKNVSQSLIDDMFSRTYDIVQTSTIINLMNQEKHSHIDLLKIDIEGAELRVLNNMLNDKIYPTYLCVEFDLKLKGRDLGKETKQTISRLKDEGYKELINKNLNITFYHKNY